MDFEIWNSEIKSKIIDLKKGAAKLVKRKFFGRKIKYTGV
jgi:hypothetical protein